MRRVLFLALVIAACATSPTGRKQLKIVPENELDQMGATAFEEMKKTTPRDTNQRTFDYVKCVAGAVAKEAAGQTKVTSWEVVVFKDDTPNAFALPGGKIGVHTGMLKVATTPGQLAAVLGHEVGHVIANHGNERVSQAFVAQGGLAAASAALGGGGELHDLAMAALGVGTQVAVMLPFSRTQESESDTIGIDLMAKAGFDPNEAVRLWENMEKAGGGQPPEFLSTHPSHGTRIQNLKARVPSATNLFNQARAAGKNPPCRP